MYVLYMCLYVNYAKYNVMPQVLQVKKLQGLNINIKRKKFKFTEVFPARTNILVMVCKMCI